MHRFITLLVLVLLLISCEKEEYSEWTFEKEGDDGWICSGPHEDERITNEQFVQILAAHQKWIEKWNRGGIALTIAEDLDKALDKKRANFCKSDLQDIDLANAKLSGVIFTGAVLTGSRLYEADLSNSELAAANLEYAKLLGANLTKANLDNAILSNALLDDINLTEARLLRADLTYADLSGADLTGADFSYADLAGVRYEPAPGKQPNIDSIASAYGLEALKYNRPRGLINLRKLLRDSGYELQERQITYALQNGKTDRLLNGEMGLTGKIVGVLNYVAFDLTTSWGLSPARALGILIFMIPIFAIAYVFALRTPTSDGIWQVWSNERVRQDLGSGEPELISIRGFSAFKLAFYFSVLSAFHIGWRDFNVGNWISRIQPREYTLRASGWTRTISGVQSLLSVYLLAMWALTTFGAPFG